MSESAEEREREAETVRGLTLLSPLLQQVLGQNDILLGESAGEKEDDRSRVSARAKHTLAPSAALKRRSSWSWTCRTHQRPALSQISLTLYFVRALVRLQSATWL